MMNFYYRHWWPRLGGAFERVEYFNSVHYGILWLGVIRDKSAKVTHGAH